MLRAVVVNTAFSLSWCKIYKISIFNLDIPIIYLEKCHHTASIKIGQVVLEADIPVAASPI
jgi:hypothetical protein